MTNFYNMKTISIFILLIYWSIMISMPYASKANKMNQYDKVVNLR